mgnify:FL=1
MQQQEKNIKGFNILELLVVLAIVGIISAVAYPGFSSWTKERKLNQAVERIQSLMKNILIQTERGTFAYVQVIFDNSDDSNLVVTSKGMTMQTLATKINNGSSAWNNDPTSRCNTSDDDYWDTDLDATSDEIKNAVYSISLEGITTNFEGASISSGISHNIGAVCFARNGKFFEGADALALEDGGTSTPQEFIYICRRVSDGDKCDIAYGGISEDVDPANETEYLRRIHWGRFGNISLTKYVNVYKITEVDGKKTKTWDDKESYWAK